MLKQDLTYIYGPDETGPNGAKKKYLQTGKTFFRALAKDLELTDSRVYDVPGGIAVTGEAVLMGMWSDGNGIYVHTRENDALGCILYRTISHMKDYRGSHNRFLHHNWLLGRYEDFVNKLLELKEEGAVHDAAA